jgi:hypothetical protein
VAGSTSVFYLGLVALGLWSGLFYFFAILAAQAITIVCAFPLYRKFIFQSQGKLLTDFVRFLSVWITGLIAGLVVTPLLVELLGWPPFEAQVVAVVAVSIGSFAGHRWFSFRTKPEVTGDPNQSPAESESL